VRYPGSKIRRAVRCSAARVNRTRWLSDPRPGAQPQRQLVLDALVAERAVAVGAADLGLVLPARLTFAVALEGRAGEDADLADRPAEHARGSVGGVLQEAAEVAHRAELHREPEATGVAATRRDPVTIIVGEEEAAGELVGRQLTREPTVVLRAHAACRGREAQHPRVRRHGSISRASIAA
jgi:hypothetical protein